MIPEEVELNLGLKKKSKFCKVGECREGVNINVGLHSLFPI